MPGQDGGGTCRKSVADLDGQLGSRVTWRSPTGDPGFMLLIGATARERAAGISTKVGRQLTGLLPTPARLATIRLLGAERAKAPLRSRLAVSA